MDQERFDRITRLLGASGSRRAGLKAAFGGLLGVGVATVAATEAPARRRRRKCDPACAAGQTCVKGTCACDNGGTVCGASCCLVGQRCEGGRCVELPDPGSCIAFGEPCKNAGRRCCENLQCGSGQGGQDDVACWVRKTGRCTSTAECIYGTECVDGVCIAPVPPPPGPTCVVAQCPVCPVNQGIDPQAVAPACIDGACGCTCQVVEGDGWEGIRCSVDTPCDSASCRDVARDSACQADSTFCCCQLR